MEDTTDAPIACTLGSTELQNRRERWLDLAPHVDGIDATPRGLRLRFRAAPGVAAELGELVVLERACCPFADWSFSDHAAGLVLDVCAARDDAIPAVQAMFGSLRRVASSSAGA